MAKSKRDERLPAKSVLELRRTEKGLRVVRQDDEGRHVYTAGLIERLLDNGEATVRITIKTQEGDADVVADLVGFEHTDGDPEKPNLTSWIVDYVKGGKTSG